MSTPARPAAGIPRPSTPSRPAAPSSRRPADEADEESFDAFCARNVRRAPRLAPIPLLFLIIRATGARAGAILMVAASAVVIPLTLLRPEVGLYAMVINFVNEFDTYYRLRQYTGGISLPATLAVAVGTGTLLQRVLRRPPRGGAMVQNWLLFGYVALVTLSVLLSDHSPRALWADFRTNFLIRPVFYVYIFLLIVTARQIHTFLLTVLAGHTLLMMTSLSDFVQKGGGLYRIQGSLGEVNYLAYVCIATMPLLIVTFLYLRDRPSKAAALGLAIATLFVSFQTLSRSAYYALAATLVFLAVRFVRRPRALLAALAFIGLFYFLVPTELTQRLEAVQDVQRTSRFYLSRIAWRMATDNPFFGVGWQSYFIEFPRYDLEQIFGKAKGAHSIYFSVAARSGFPALVLYLAMYGITLSQLFAIERRYRRARAVGDFGYHLAVGLQAGIVGHFVFGLAGSYENSYYAYMLLGMSVVLIRYHRHQRNLLS